MFKKIVILGSIGLSTIGGGVAFHKSNTTNSEHQKSTNIQPQQNRLIDNDKISNTDPQNTNKKEQKEYHLEKNNIDGTAVYKTTP